MAFFVDSEDEDDGQPAGRDGGVPESYALEWIFVGKNAGLSLAEMNEFRVRDLAALVELKTGGKTGPRRATQADIDRFYGV
jgi:hypothetical protein